MHDFTASTCKPISSLKNKPQHKKRPNNSKSKDHSARKLTEEDVLDMAKKYHRDMQRHLEDDLDSTYPRQLPNSTYDERLAFLQGLLAQAGQGTLVDPNDLCGPFVAYFDFVIQETEYILGNLGSGAGMITGSAMGESTGASIGQSAGFVSGSELTSMLQTAARPIPNPRRERRHRRRTQDTGATKPTTGNGGGGMKKDPKHRRGQYAEGTTAAGGGMGMGAGFAIGVPAGIALGGAYGKLLGSEYAAWLIRDFNYAVAYSLVLPVALLINALEIIVRAGGGHDHHTAAPGG